MTEKFPAINSTLSPNELGKLIQQKIWTKDKTECSIFRIAMNHLYICLRWRKQICFRVYTHNWRTKLEIEEELRLLLHLKETDGQVAFPLADKSKPIHSGNRSTGRKKVWRFIFVRQRHKDSKIFATDKFFIGQALAKVHQSTENFELARMSLQYSEFTLTILF